MRVMSTHPGTSPRSLRRARPFHDIFFMVSSFLHGVKSKAMSPG